MIEIAGEDIDYIAFHHHFDPGRTNEGSILRDNDYRKDSVATWEALMNGYNVHANKIAEMRENIGKSNMPLALTECHYGLRGRNRCEVLSSWAAGVSYARLMNLHERNGDLLKIATLADFCGTRWMTNALMIQFPIGNCHMMPVANIMSLYRRHSGKYFIGVEGVHEDLDVTASLIDNKIYLHVVNKNRTNPLKSSFKVNGMNIESGKAFELVTDPEFEILDSRNNPLIPRERILSFLEPIVFPAAYVAAVELTVRKS